MASERGDHCLDDEQVAALCAGRVTEERRQAIDRHLCACGTCRALVATIARLTVPSDVPPEGEPPRGRVLGERYELHDLLGVGSGGSVYASFDRQLRRKVAVKLLKPLPTEGGSAQESEARLLREAHAMAQVTHPNVLAIHDAGVADGMVFIVTDLIEGGTLQDWLAADRRGWREILAIFLEAGRGLAAAHAAGLVHRDFKPANVLIGASEPGPSGSKHAGARVTDFGLARPAAAAAGPAGSAAAPVAAGGQTALAGTPPFMAPEQFAGGITDARTDQFSFCVALFTALFGRHPFVASAALPPIETLARAVTAGTPVPPAAEGEVPAAVVRTLLRGLQVDPARRHPSMEALLASLGDGAAGRGGRRWLRPAAVAAGVAIAAAAALGPGRRFFSGEDVRCGDGLLRATVEECDDGNDIDGDGCTTACLRCAGGDAVAWNGHCYERREDAQTFAAARARCQERGGDLATLTTTAEGAAVLRALTRGPKPTWVGFHQRRPEPKRESSSVDPRLLYPGTFEWVTGEPVLQLWWAPDEPRPGRYCAHHSPDHRVVGIAAAAANIGALVADDCETPSPYICERSGWVSRPNHSGAYRLLPQAITWDQARADCQRLGGDMVTLSDAEEQTFAMTLGGRSLWLGATDRQAEGEFRWVSNEAFAFHPFAPPEPDDQDGTHDCLVLGPDRLWHDRRCNDRNATVCETR